MLPKTKKRIRNAVFAAVFTASAAAGALFGAPRLGEAWWGPWEPENYWDPVRISWRDTYDPGHYFYRDLARQGGSVYDYTRHLKSVLFADNFLNILASLSEQLGIDLKNAIPLGEDEQKKTGEIVMKNGDRVPILYEKIRIGSLKDSPYFHTYDETPEQYDAPRDRIMQRRLISAAMENYVQVAQGALEDSEATEAAVQALLEAAATAEGERELQDIITRLEALKASEKTKLSAMLAAKTQLGRDLEAQALDDEIERQKSYEKAELLIIDPYDKELAKSYPYERDKPRGLVPFE